MLNKFRSWGKMPKYENPLKGNFAIVYMLAKYVPGDITYRMQMNSGDYPTLHVAQIKVQQ
jgi:hypothetical protein